VVITIDGPAGTGKSTVAHYLASRLGFDFLDTGAMYRAAALLAIEHGIDPAAGAELADLVNRSDLHFDWRSHPPHMLIGNRDVSERIRERDVAECVSIVAGRPEVRAVLVEHQRRIADRHARLVSEGRDQGSVVFPDARLKFFLHADTSVRAQRRFDQDVAGGRAADLESIQREIVRRDELDSTREVGPLICPDTAIIVDTSAMSLETVVDHLEGLVRRQLLPDHFDDSERLEPAENGV